MLKDVFREPLAVEALFALFGVVALVLVVRALRGVADRMARRKALSEFVSGVDLFFKGEFEAAVGALRKALERDPENCEARILLGDACREIGELAEAHKHHFQVSRVFGQDLPRNRLSLGKDLLEMGRCEEAIPHLQEALSADPDDPGALKLLLRAQVDAGRTTQALAVSERLLRSSAGPARELAKRQRAALLAQAGRESLRDGNAREGVQLFRSALKLHPSLVAPRLEIVRATWMHGSDRAAEKELVQQLKDMVRLAGDPTTVFESPAPTAERRPEMRAVAVATDPLPALASGAALPPPSDGESGTALLPFAPDREEREESAPVSTHVTEEFPGSSMPMKAGAFVKALLPREAVYLCRECGRGETRFVETCACCGGFGTLVAADRTSLASVPGIRDVFDVILENRAFVRSLVRRAAAGDEGAARRLGEMGSRVAGSVIRELLRQPENAQLVGVLAALGPEAIPRILEAFRRTSAFSTKRLVRQGVRAFRSVRGAVVAALAEMGEGAAEHMESLLEDGSRDDRLIALDVLLRLGRAESVERARVFLSAKDLLERMNACPHEGLVDFLASCPSDGYLMTQVLVDRTFSGDRALVAALAHSGNRRKIRWVLMERGFSPEAYESLEAIWAREELRAVVNDVVRSYGRTAADHLLKTYVSSDVHPRVKDDALSHLVNMGGGEVDRIVERLAENDPETERAVLKIVTVFGSRAVPALVRAYGKTGILERMGFNRRRIAYRKITLIRALAKIGTYDALQGLKQIRDRESDADLGHRIRTVMDRMSGKKR